MFVLRTWALPKWKWMSILPPWSLRSPSWARQEPASGKVGRIMAQKSANSEHSKSQGYEELLWPARNSCHCVYVAPRPRLLAPRVCIAVLVSTKHESHKITSRSNMPGKRIAYGSSNSFFGLLPDIFFHFFPEIFIVPGTFYWRVPISQVFFFGILFLLLGALVSWSYGPLVPWSSGPLVLCSFFVSFFLTCLLLSFTSSTARGGGGSFKNSKRIGCCESRTKKQKQWQTVLLTA